MLQGRIRWFNRERKFGWIAGDDGHDYAVQQAAVGDATALEEGMRVEFDPARGAWGDKAINVRVIIGTPRAA